MQSQQMAAQAAQLKIQLESQAKIQLEQAKTQLSMQRLDAEANAKLMLMEREFEMNMQLRGLTEADIADREKGKEDAKSERISQQNTQQSKLIEQRKNNLPSINFESNEDSLDGFDLAEFSPR